MGIISASAKLAGRQLWNLTKKGTGFVAPRAWEGVKDVTGAGLTVVGAGVDVGTKAAVKGLKAADTAIEKGPTGWAGRKLANGIANHFHPENLIRYDEDGMPKALNKKGIALIGGLIAADGAYTAANTDEKAHMGTIDSHIYTATPDYQQYVKMKTPKTTYSPAPAGADGSLVFALNNAKNGGFL